MSPNIPSDDLAALVHYALHTTRATTVCPSTTTSPSASATMQPRATRSSAPSASSKATGRAASQRYSGRKSAASSRSPPMGDAQSATGLVRTRTRSAASGGLRSSHEPSANASGRHRKSRKHTAAAPLTVRDSRHRFAARRAQLPVRKEHSHRIFPAGYSVVPSDPRAQQRRGKLYATAEVLDLTAAE